MLIHQRSKRRIVALLLLLSASGCQPDSESIGNEDADQNQTRPQLPVAEPPLDRKALLSFVAEAASAAALGVEDSKAQQSLDGKRFEVRIRFGCPTAALPKGGGPFSVRYNEADRTLRIRATPDLSLDEPGLKAWAGESVEAVEGFWMRRPWLLTDGCAAAAPLPESPDGEKLTDSQASADSTLAVKSSQRVGLAQFFSQSDARTGRRDGRPYETTKVLAEGEAPSAGGYNLVLSGRLRGLAERRVITCRVTSIDVAPECIVSAAFDRVRIEDPASKAVIAEWSS